MKLTPNEQLVLSFLRNRALQSRDKYVSPTEIGRTLHPSRGYGSPWASPICKRLVAKGLLSRTAKGLYAVK